MKPLVLGGAGFIGLNLARALMARGYPVRVTRRRSSNTIFLRKVRGIEVVDASLEDPDSLEHAMAGQDVVFCAAAPYPRDSLDAAGQVVRARELVRNAVEAAKKADVERFVFTSSVATVAKPSVRGALATEDDVLERVPRGSTYHAVKLAAEKEVLRAARQGLRAVVLCPTGCLGELDVKAGTGFFLVALGNGLLPFWVDGRLNMVDVDDVAEAHIEAALRGRIGERYILGGHNTTVGALLDAARRELGVPMPSRRLPIPVAWVLSTLGEIRARRGPSAPRAFVAREFVDMVRLGQHVDSSKAVRELGLHKTELADTLRKACKWFERNRYIKKGTKPCQPSVQPTSSATSMPS